MSGLTLPIFSPLQNASRPPFSPFQRSPYGGPLADCGRSLALLPNIFLTSSGLMFQAGLPVSLSPPSILQLPSTTMGKPPHSLVLFGQTLSQKTSCHIPRLRSAGIWLVRRSNVETRHVRSSCSLSPLGRD